MAALSVTSVAPRAETALFELRGSWIAFWREHFDEGNIDANLIPANADLMPVLAKPGTSFWGDRK